MFKLQKTAVLLEIVTHYDLHNIVSFPESLTSLVRDAVKQSKLGNCRNKTLETT